MIEEHEYDFSDYTVEQKATLNEWGTDYSVLLCSNKRTIGVKSSE